MNEKTFDLKNLIRSFRQQGNTTYLLDSAINDPNVTIIVANKAHAKEMEEQYKHRLKNLVWWKKLMRKLSGKDAISPKFIPVRNSKDLQGVTRTPIIIDLYAIASSL